MATKQKAKDFLHKVSTDAKFREQVEADPVKHLAAHGFQVKPEQVPKEGIKLPSNQKIQEHMDHLSDRMEATAGEVFFLA